MFLTGADVLDDIFYGPHTLCRSFVSNLVEICLKASRTLWKIDDISGVVAGVD
jgi:hypothetical protein